MSLSLIYAHDKRGGIGINNKLPWHIKEDLKFFKNKTKGSIILMGKNTFTSLPASLPDREMVVVSNSLQEGEWCNVVVFSDLLAALKYCNESEKETFVIGGASIYKQLESYADFIYETEIFEEYDCDTFYQFKKENFEVLEKKETTTESGVVVSFNVYKNLNKISL